jgi:hypothetical protein
VDGAVGNGHDGGDSSASGAGEWQWQAAAAAGGASWQISLAAAMLQGITTKSSLSFDVAVELKSLWDELLAFAPLFLR